MTSTAMKLLFGGLFLLLATAPARAVCPSDLSDDINARGGTEEVIRWPKHRLEDVRCTPIRTDAEKALLISTAGRVNGDFTSVTPSQDQVAFSTTVFSCTYDGNTIAGDLTNPMVVDKKIGLRILLTRKLLLYEYLIEIQKELTAAQALGIIDIFAALKIQRLRSVREFGTRLYNAM